MVWLTGVVAIALMLAVLTIPPNQLAVISTSVSSVQWQTTSYICIAVIFSMVLFWWLAQKSVLYPTPPKNKALLESNSHLDESTVVYLNPINTLTKQGVVTLLIKVTCVLFFWCAVIFNTLAQRIDALQQSPQRTLYVKALVTPVGLSDRVLTVNQAGVHKVIANVDSFDAKNIDAKNAEVVQGYRQLVQLTQIKPYSDLDNRSNQGGTLNPLHVNHLQPIRLPETAAGISQPNQSEELPKQMTVMLSSYDIEYGWLNHLDPNKQVTMQLALEPLEHGTANNGFNAYRWLSTRHATASAKIMSASINDIVRVVQPTLWQKINTYRYYLRQHFLQLIQAQQSLPQDNDDTASDISDKSAAADVTLSLLTGDRSLISSEMTEVYRFSGISHLLAISGSHVLFLAILSATLASFFVNRFFPKLYRILPRWQLSFTISVVVAFVYALFAGFDVPALRTALMLLVAGMVRYVLAVPSIFKLLLVIALVMAWQDSVVLWQAGFWLSFVAVSVLIVYSQCWGHVGNTNHTSNHASALLLDRHKIDSEVTRPYKISSVIISFLKLQVWISIALLPLSLWFFGKVSLWGFLVNLFAIGLFGWVIVPLNLLAGLSYVFFPTLADGIWSVLFWVLEQFHTVLFLLQDWASQIGWLYSSMSLPLLLLLFLVALPWVLPTGVVSRIHSIPIITVIMVVPFLQNDNSPALTSITPLNILTENISATLVKSHDITWLLLSGYPNGYGDDKVIPDSSINTAMLQVYDELKIQNVDSLTGVVVQTATPELASLIASLRKDIPISYYWQAGLEGYEKQVEHALKDISLTAQSCKVGQSWSADLINQTQNGLSISALTGWSDINDKAVWDCTLHLSCREPVIVKQEASDKDRAMSSGLLVSSTAVADDMETNIVFHTSTQKRHAKLWQLMCLDGRSNGSNKHWLLSPQSYVEKDIIDSLHPQSWRVIYQPNKNSINSVSEKQKEMQLYWQQQQKQTEQ